MSRTEVKLAGWQEEKEGGEEDDLRHRSIIGQHDAGIQYFVPGGQLQYTVQ
jgi:hypothetical protein